MRILVTRPQAEGTAAALRARGHEPILGALLRIEYLECPALDREIWTGLIVTSTNAVRAIAQSPHLRTLRDLPVFTVGQRTADEARRLGWRDIHSASGDQSDLVRLLADSKPQGRLLYLAGEQRTGDLGRDLAAHQILSETIVVYRAVSATRFPKHLRERLQQRSIDAILHYSRRSAAAFVSCALSENLASEARQIVHFCLSDAVAQELQALGPSSIRISAEPTEPALLALLDFQP